jgi:hypothetical protein
MVNTWLDGLQNPSGCFEIGGKLLPLPGTEIDSSVLMVCDIVNTAKLQVVGIMQRIFSG